MVEARKLILPLNPSPSTSFSSSFPPRPSSLLFDPDSLSLAIMLEDSSVSLFSQFSLSSSPSLPPPQTLIPAPSSSACFLRFDPNPVFAPNPNPSSASLTLFVTAGPSHDGSRVLLRFFVRSKEAVGFVRPRIGCGQKGLNFNRQSGGVLVTCSHGMKVVLAGSVNYFVMYSASAAKVWVFGLKAMAVDREDVDSGVGGVNLRLVKCAVIDCLVPVSSVSLSSGFLVMGELNGVRIFPFRPLVKGWVGRKKKLSSRIVSKENDSLEGVTESKLKGEYRNSKLPNGFVKGQEGSYDLGRNGLDQLKFKVIGHVAGHKNAVGMPRLVPNGVVVASYDGTHGSSVKPKSQKLSQDSNKWGACFVPFNCNTEGLVSTKSTYTPKRAISIHSVSQNKFLVADSDGGVHILCASISSPSIMRQLTDVIEVQQIAVLPLFSESSQTVWLSDGYNSVHVMALSDANSSSNENESDSEDVRLSVSVIQTIFASENIRDVKPLSANAILILGKDNLYAYAIS